MKRNNTVINSNEVWEVQNLPKSDKCKFYQEQIKKYRELGNMELVSYYVTLYTNSKPKKKEEVFEQPSVIVIPDNAMDEYEII